MGDERGREEYNTVKNCYAVNANHDDGFRSWSTGPGGVGTGTVTSVVLRGNLIINYEDPNQPSRGTLQGIGMFDGTFVDWVIENNVIITDHWHGSGAAGDRRAPGGCSCRLGDRDVPGAPLALLALLALLAAHRRRGGGQ